MFCLTTVNPQDGLGRDQNRGLASKVYSWKEIFGPGTLPGKGSALTLVRSEAKEKCCKEQTVGNKQSEDIRKRPYSLPQKMHFLVPHFLAHSACEISLFDSISHCALLVLLVMCINWAPQE
jgi:hypothetical protein